MRNHITHGYFDIDAGQTLDTVERDLVPLKVAVEALIGIAEGNKQRINS